VSTRLSKHAKVDLPETLPLEALQAFIQIASSLTGIQLDESKRSMLYTRLSRRLRALGLSSFEQYLELLRSGDGVEIEAFTNTVTTNLTYFFREPHHFEFLRATVLPKLFVTKRARPARIWSAGCSSGEEPYSIAMTIAESGLANPQDYRLLCTDLNSDMVRQTASGVYPIDALRGLDDARLTKWFTEDQFGRVQAKPLLRESMLCRQHNIFLAWPIRAGVDVIFCRNL